MNIIWNLTQHAATPDQIAAGVIDPDEGDRAEIRELLTFTSLPDAQEIERRAKGLAAIASILYHRSWRADHRDSDPMGAMIGGAPYLMGPLERAIHRCRADIVPVYAYSDRVSVEETLPDGSIRKTQVFRHAGFVEAPVDDPR
jgi:hypothetical protein